MTKIPPPLLITGAPRSGTSLTAHAFRACGAWAGRTTTQCENGPIRQRTLKPILRDAGMDELALRSFADAGTDPEELRRDVLGAIEEQGYDGGPWLYKDAKLVFCWRSWAIAFPDAVWAVVWRPPSRVVESMGRWGIAKKYDFDAGRVVREHHSRARRIHRADEVSRSFALFPDRFVRGDCRAYRAVAEAAGVSWDRRTARGVVDPDRYRVGTP